MRHVLPLKKLDIVDWSAKGGRGGNGGKGGNGGNGGRGGRGRDATQLKAGTKGKPGGAGGNAGFGSSGENAGDGGTVEIHVKERDTFLLMAIGKCG